MSVWSIAAEAKTGLGVYANMQICFRAIRKLAHHSLAEIFSCSLCQSICLLLRSAPIFVFLLCIFLLFVV